MMKKTNSAFFLWGLVFPLFLGCPVIADLADKVPEVLDFPAVPDAPVLSAGNQHLYVTWPAVRGAASYSLWVNTVDNLSTASLSVTDVTGYHATIASLVNGTAYFVWLRANNNIGTSDFSASSNAVPADNSDGVKTFAFQNAPGTDGDHWLAADIQTNAYWGDPGAGFGDEPQSFSWLAQSGSLLDNDGVIALAAAWPLSPPAAETYRAEANMPAFDSAHLHDLSGGAATVETKIYVPQDYIADACLNLQLLLKDATGKKRWSEIIMSWRLSWGGGWFTISWALGSTDDNYLTVQDQSGTTISATAWFADDWNTDGFDQDFDITQVKVITAAFSATNFNDRNGNPAIIDATDLILIDYVDDGIPAVF